MKNTLVAATFVVEKQETEVRHMEWLPAFALLCSLLLIGVCTWGAWREAQLARRWGCYHPGKDWYK